MSESEKPKGPKGPEQEPQYVLDYRRLNKEMKLLYSIYSVKTHPDAYRSGEKMWLEMNGVFEELFNGNESKIHTTKVDQLIEKSKRLREVLEVVT